MIKNTKIIKLSLFLLLIVFFFNSNIFATANVENIKYYTDIPNEYNKDFILFYPTTNIITRKSKVLIKGKNNFLTPVFVNGQSVDLRKDGRFFYQMDFFQKGDNLIIITFCTPDYNKINIAKKITFFNVPNNEILDLKSNNLEANDVMFFLNSKFAHKKLVEKFINSPVTREDLAFFIAQLNNISEKEISNPVFQDVSASHWCAKYIQYVVDNNIMNEYPDGNFYPEKSITKIEFLISLIRAYQLKLNKEVTKLPYQDVVPTHWTAKYIRTSLDNGFIEPSAKLEVNKEISILNLVKLASNLEEVKKEIAQVKDSNKIITINSEMLDKINEKINPILTQKIAEKFHNQKLELENIVDGQLFFKPMVILKGTVYPPSSVSINNQLIQPTIEGYFEIALKLKQNINTFNISSLDNSKTITLFHLESYKDLSGHWLEQTAAKARYFNFVETTDTFNPDKIITKAELAHYINSFLQLKEIENNNVSINNIVDLNPTQQYLIEIRNAILNNIFIIDSTNQFNPENSVTRIEALVAICRALNLKENISISKERLIFRDISKKHWALNTLKIALDNNIISKSRYFRPKQYITKAELIAMLTNTPPIKQKIKNIFK